MEDLFQALHALVRPAGESCKEGRHLTLPALIDFECLHARQPAESRKFPGTIRPINIASVTRILRLFVEPS